MKSRYFFLPALAVSFHVFPIGLHGESFDDSAVFQSASIEQLHNSLLGLQYLNEVSAPALVGGASIHQRINGHTIATQAGMTSINRVTTWAALRGTSVVQSYFVRETSASVGWIQVNDVTLSGFGAPKKILQSHVGTSVSSTGWPVFINIYAR